MKLQPLLSYQFLVNIDNVTAIYCIEMTTKTETHLNKLINVKRKPKRPSRMGNPEIQETLATRHEDIKKSRN